MHNCSLSPLTIHNIVKQFRDSVSQFGLWPSLFSRFCSFCSYFSVLSPSTCPLSPTWSHPLALLSQSSATYTQPAPSQLLLCSTLLPLALSSAHTHLFCIQPLHSSLLLPLILTRLLTELLSRMLHNAKLSHYYSKISSTIFSDLVALC